jgi:hypothetical protein
MPQCDHDRACHHGESMPRSDAWFDAPGPGPIPPLRSADVLVMFERSHADDRARAACAVETPGKNGVAVTRAFGMPTMILTELQAVYRDFEEVLDDKEVGDAFASATASQAFDRSEFTE